MISVSLRLLRERDIAKAMKQQLLESALQGTRRAADVVVGALRRASTSGPLHRRTGMLARSWMAGPPASGPEGTRIVVEPIAQDDTGGTKVGSVVKYAGIHQKGGVIKPKDRKLLTIPTGENLTAAGVARYPTVASLKQAFGADKVFMVKRDGKAPVIMAKTGKTDRSVKLFFATAPQVTIKGTGYITGAVQEAEPRARAVIVEEINRGQAR